MVKKVRSVGEGFHERDTRLNYFVKYADRQNFGDYLPELFAKYLLSYPRVQADLYYFVGSVIEESWIKRALRQATGFPAGVISFWGCGMRNETPLSPTARALCRFHGVRGPVTRDLLGLPADTVLGDPGLLVPLIYPKPNIPTQPGADLRDGNTICIPHISDESDDTQLLALSGCGRVVRPEIEASEAGLAGIISEIAQADFVLSNSLHGAIIACAYDVPFAFWDSGHIDCPLKWRDFSQSIGIPDIFARNLRQGIELYRENASLIAKPKAADMLLAAPWGCRIYPLMKALAADGTDISDGDALIEYLEAREKIEIQKDFANDKLNMEYNMRKEMRMMQIISDVSKNAQYFKRTIFEKFSR
ncbi:polysaccharide pyruvyl transferase family protein [Tsuneonella sp. CC-YZS046]|uniref:polysaccharide pyruvyl transferase family protein n=1 Tax=Tsuneonella sp. CC-YZS046 TaxID=3042152 RepID=UPI002D770BE2|nr:polysaccharide pyruvyl transferase family protein [Tsuneonella sp. CC-YZS046]WRO65648.1 polysaccharide pyruvyl transferase family protein [Tsuneonella sp. CC-YZS046]